MMIIGPEFIISKNVVLLINRKPTIAPKFRVHLQAKKESKLPAILQTGFKT